MDLGENLNRHANLAVIIVDLYDDQGKYDRSMELGVSTCLHTARNVVKEIPRGIPEVANRNYTVTIHLRDFKTQEAVGEPEMFLVINNPVKTIQFG